MTGLHYAGCPLVVVDSFEIIVCMFETGSLSCLESGSGFGVGWLAFGTESNMDVIRTFLNDILYSLIRRLEAIRGLHKTNTHKYAYPASTVLEFCPHCT
jgi:hypothetical protein